MWIARLGLRGSSRRRWIIWNFRVRGWTFFTGSCQLHQLCRWLRHAGPFIAPYASKHASNYASSALTPFVDGPGGSGINVRLEGPQHRTVHKSGPKSERYKTTKIQDFYGLFRDKSHNSNVYTSLLPTSCLNINTGCSNQRNKWRKHLKMSIFSVL